MDTTIAYFVLGLIVLGITIWRIKVKNEVDRQNAEEWSASDALKEFRDTIALVEKFAPAADQLVKIGELTPEARAAFVIEEVEQILDGIDPAMVRAVTEWWVATQKPELKKTLAELNSAAGK